MANPVSSVSSACSPRTLLSKAKLPTQSQSQSNLSYLKTPFPSANRAQPQVKHRPHRKARKAQANQNPAKPNKSA